MNIRSVNGLLQTLCLRDFKLGTRLAVAIVFFAAIAILSRWFYRTVSLPPRRNLSVFDKATIFYTQASAAGFGDAHPRHQSPRVVRRTAIQRGDPPVA
jgi:hypothetical protein